MKKILCSIITIIFVLLNIICVYGEPIIFEKNETDFIPFTIEIELEKEIIDNLQFVKKLATTETFNTYNEMKQKELEEKKKQEERKNEQRKITYTTPTTATESEIEMLAKIIYAEARGECYDGKVAVGAVVLNRVKSSRYPNNIKDVIFARNQFSPVSNGTYASARPTDAEYQAARDALNGIDPTNGALTFYAYKLVKSKYHESMTHTATIGNHKFFK